MPDISVLIVNFNGGQYIDRCLAALFASDTDLTYEVLVLDNASQDDSCQRLHAYADRIMCTYNTENIGFSRGVNQLLAQATGTYTLLLNSDAFLYETTLQDLYDCLESDPTIGVVAPKLYNEDGSLQVPGSKTRMARRIYDTDTPKPVKFLSGAVMLLQTDYFRERLNGLDPVFFFYNDDIDLCWRIRADKRQVYYAANTAATHSLGASSKTIKTHVLIEGYRGGLWLIKKHYNPVVYNVYRIGLIGLLIIKSLYHSTGCLFSKTHRSHIMVCFRVINLAWQDPFGSIQSSNKDS